MVEIQMVIINSLGEFYGRKTTLSNEDYLDIIKMSKDFYKNGSFDLTCEDGSFIVFAPVIVQNSILKIKKRIIDV